MEKEEFEECLPFFTDMLQEFINFKKQSKEKQNKINEYKKSKPYQYKEELSLIAAEPVFDYPKDRKRTLIPFDDIICYMEELPIERTEDGKTIQLMLYELVGQMCDEDEYKRISNAMKNKKSQKEPTGEKAMKMLAEFISNLKAEGMTGKRLLVPYASAYNQGFAKKMSVDEFNHEFGTKIKTSTYYNWMSPVFSNTPNYKYAFSSSEMIYYDRQFEELN